MKICVYAISKNEEKHVQRFCKSAKDADLIVICDTGSTDNTVEIAKQYARVYNISVVPWRFDMARNIALGLVPEDIEVCVVLDLDEVLVPGWREEIERIWIPGETNTLRHLFKNSDRYDAYQYTRIFSRFGWVWKGICHEGVYIDPRCTVNRVFSEMVLIHHLPDITKPREFYCDLIKANVNEYPLDLFARYYYMRERYIDKKYDECIIEADKIIDLCPSTVTRYCPGFNKYELNHVYLIKGDILEQLTHYTEAEKAYKNACKMNLDIRQPFITLALFYFNREEFALCHKFCMKALRIQKKLNRREEGSERYWGYSPWNWAAVSAARVGWINKAIECEKRAIELCKDYKKKEELEHNIKVYESLIYEGA